MTAGGAVWVDVALSLAAVAGLAVLQRAIVARGADDPLNRRFLFGLRVSMLLFAGRAVVALTGLQGLRGLVLLAAALIPICVLILTEGLLRRHAPAWVKAVIGGGTALFTLAALAPAALVDPVRTTGLMLFQLGGLLVSGGLIVMRDRATLSAAENRAVERLGLSLILLIPLVAADYLMVRVGLPVQLSALAVLTLSWLAISLGRTEAGHGGTLASFLAIVLAAGVAAALIGIVVGLDRSGAILMLAIILAATLLAAIVNDARALRSEEQSLSLLRHMADNTGADAVAFLRGLAAHPLVEGAVLIDAAVLADLDGAVLARVFAAHPVLRRSDAATGSTEGDHIAHLFDRFAATHVLLAAEAPLQLMALAMPALSASPRAELELRVVQRMAWLMARGQGDAA